MEKERTKGPWRAVLNSRYWEIRTADGENLAIGDVCASEFLPGGDAGEANAAFIVRAANSHEELVEALRGYMAQFGQALDANGITYGPAQRAADERARAAIQLATA